VSHCITPRQYQLLAFIERYRVSNDGDKPTQKEMAKALKCIPHTIRELLAPLERKGFILRKRGSARGIRILKLDWRDAQVVDERGARNWKKNLKRDNHVVPKSIAQTTP
jgi:SOS-response transcriptional repressor LexA